MIRLMKLDGSTVALEPRTITRVEREGNVTRISTGLGQDILVVETPDEVLDKIETETIAPSGQAV